MNNPGAHGIAYGHGHAYGSKLANRRLEYISCAHRPSYMRRRYAIGLALAVAVMLGSPAAAYARFGKASSGGGHSSGRATVHTSGGSTRVTSSSSSRAWHSSSSSSAPVRVGVRPSIWAAPRVSAGWGPPRYQVWGYGYAVAPTVVVPGPPSPPIDENGEFRSSEQLVPPPSVVSAIAGDVTFAGASTMLGGLASFEGARVGFVGAYTGVLSPSQDAYSNSVDVLHLAQARVSYALVSGERGRLRAELGAHLAAAPDVTFLAPGVGLSGVLGLGGPFGLEGRVFGNAWPYSQIDARAGLTVASAKIGLSLGYRVLYLNDHGVLGPANAGATSDFYRGPYVTLSFAL
jgi:hypothetical protein